MRAKKPRPACIECGATFEPKSNTALSKAKFCGTKCYGEWRSKDPTIRAHMRKISASGREAAKLAPRPDMTGPRNPCWRGGSYIEPGKGYRLIRRPSHPRARANGYVLEHILVAESMLGRPLADGEEVHHRNLDRSDNRPENLQIFASHRQHWIQEHLETVIAARDAAFSRRSSQASRQD